HGGVGQDVVHPGDEPLHDHQHAEAVKVASTSWPDLLLQPGLDGCPERGGARAYAHENLFASRLRSAFTAPSVGSRSTRHANSRNMVRDGRYWATRRCAPASWPSSAAIVGQSLG